MTAKNTEARDADAVRVRGSVTTLNGGSGIERATESTFSASPSRGCGSRVKSRLRLSSPMPTIKVPQSMAKEDRFPARFTRDWFGWANAMFSELALDLCAGGVRHLFPSRPA